MSDIIKLLPEHIANQIAAGEVIQRPASVVKELLENSIDAGSTYIQLIILDAGKKLIQVVDNGKGMSVTDLRMCFERHATSKISSADDLFNLNTKGFRGEAMASIAAIAQVETKTKRAEDEVGSSLKIEGSKVVTQEPCSVANGTSISVKNLFYNVPARRNFLKSNPVETRHIVDEFQRVALAHPEIFFSLHHNGSEVFHLPSANLRQRVINIFGKNTNKKLVPVEEDTEIVRINGFVGKPEFSRKTRGEQYLFVNDRFIKSGYLNHAINNVYQGLMPKEHFPLYIIFLYVDPASIDINVHPTKQEVKFEDERVIYTYLNVAVKHALGKYAVMPTLDFDQETSFNNVPPISQNMKAENSDKRFQQDSSGSSGIQFTKSARDKSNLQNWQSLYENFEGETQEKDSEESETITFSSKMNETESSEQSMFEEDVAKIPIQIHKNYIQSQLKSGLMLIHQQAAHERILFEQYLNQEKEQKDGHQQQLFPKEIELSALDTILVKSMMSEFHELGIIIEAIKENTFVIQAKHQGLSSKSEEQLIEQVLQNFRDDQPKSRLTLKEQIAYSFAKSKSIKMGQRLDPDSMQMIIDKLFACEVPYISPSGKPTFTTFSNEMIAQQFEKK